MEKKTFNTIIIIPKWLAKYKKEIHKNVPPPKN
jgi:hypothetical protein